MLPWIIFWVSDTSIIFSYSALSGHGSAFPPDGICCPLDVTFEPNALQPPPAPCDCSPQAQQQGVAEVIQCHRGDSRRDKELSEMLRAQRRAPTLHRWPWRPQGCPPRQRLGSYLETAEDSVEVVESQDTVVDSQEAKEPGSANN